MGSNEKQGDYIINAWPKSIPLPTVMVLSTTTYIFTWMVQLKLWSTKGEHVEWVGVEGKVLDSHIFTNEELKVS